MTFDPRVVSFRRPQPESPTEHVVSYLDEAKRWKAYSKVEAELDWHAIILIGHGEPVPRYFGDNVGHCGVSIRVTTAPDKYIRKEDASHPQNEQRILEKIWIPYKPWADRFKDAIDVCLNGATKAEKMRHAWWDWPEWQRLWPELLQEAERRLIEQRQIPQWKDSDGPIYWFNDKGKEELTKFLTLKSMGITR